MSATDNQKEAAPYIPHAVNPDVVIDDVSTIHWRDSLVTSSAAKEVMKQINEGIAKIVGRGCIYAAVSELANVAQPVICDSASEFQNGDTLAKAIADAYGVRVKDESIIILIHPDQLYYHLQDGAIDQEENYWDSVVYYISETASRLVPDWIGYSIIPPTIILVSQMLPVDDYLKRKIGKEALEQFVGNLLGYETALEEMDELDYDKLERIQPFLGTLFKSLTSGQLTVPRIQGAITFEALVGLARQTYEHGGITMMDPAHMAKA